MGLKKADLDREYLASIVRRVNLTPYQRAVERGVGRGRDHWKMHGKKSRADFDAWLMRRRGRSAEEIAACIDVARGEPVSAFINDNRWMARCECGGYAVVDPLEPEFYCHNCYNALNSGYPRPLAFPPTQDLRKIERLLEASADPLWRNWTPFSEDGNDPGASRQNRAPTKDEVAASIEKLEAENAVIGLSEVVQ